MGGAVWVWHGASARSTAQSVVPDLARRATAGQIAELLQAQLVEAPTQGAHGYRAKAHLQGMFWYDNPPLVRPIA
jgi:hypothetical protein